MSAGHVITLSPPLPFLSSLSLFSFGQAAGEDIGDLAGCCLRRGGVGEDEGVGGRRRAVRWRGDTGEGALRGSPAWGTTMAWGTSSSIRTRISASSASSGSSTPVVASDSNSSAMPSDLTVSRATLARSSRSGWIEAVVVDRAAQGAPVQPAAVGTGEGAAAAPELHRRVQQPRRAAARRARAGGARRGGRREQGRPTPGWRAPAGAARLAAAVGGAHGDGRVHQRASSPHRREFGRHRPPTVMPTVAPPWRRAPATPTARRRRGRGRGRRRRLAPGRRRSHATR